jgi:hypothetical protein
MLSSTNSRAINIYQTVFSDFATLSRLEVTTPFLNLDLLASVLFPRHLSVRLFGEFI